MKYTLNTLYTNCSKNDILNIYRALHNDFSISTLIQNLDLKINTGHSKFFICVYKTNNVILNKWSTMDYLPKSNANKYATKSINLDVFKTWNSL